MLGNDERTAMMAEWKKLLGEIREQHRRDAEAFQALGLDSEKLRAAVDARLGHKEKEEVVRLIVRDLADVDREVEWARACMKIGGGRAIGGRKFRSMV